MYTIKYNVHQKQSYVVPWFILYRINQHDETQQTQYELEGCILSLFQKIGK